MYFVPIYNNMLISYIFIGIFIIYLGINILYLLYKIINV